MNHFCQKFDSFSFTTFQELYVRQGITPKYDLVQIEGAVHEPTFKYRVTVGDAVATGNITLRYDI